MLEERLNSGFCAFECDFSLLVEHFVAWKREVLQPYQAGVDHGTIEGSLSSLIETLDPVVRPIGTKHLFLRTASRWVIVLDNGHLGTDGAFMPVMSRMLSCRALRAVSRPDAVSRSKGGEYGAQILEVFSNGEPERTLFCANDGGRWTFGQSGNPYSFENVSSYDARRIADRFRRGDLIHCLDQLGLHPYDSSWFDLENGLSSAAVVIRTGKLPKNHEELIQRSSGH